MIRNETNPVEPISTPHGTVTTRPETADDIAFLFELHASVKGAELALMPVGETMRRHLLEMQFRAMTAGYRATFPAARYAIITLNELPVGRLITDNTLGRFHIVHIALLPEWRNRGIGLAVMTAVLSEPRLLGTPCEAIVGLDNVASLRLWARLGFTERERGDTDFILEWRPT